MPQLGANAGAGEGWLVVEGDESDRSVAELRPRVAVVTNVDLDHHATFGSRAEVEALFEGGSRRCRTSSAGGSSSPLEFELAVPGEHNRQKRRRGARGTRARRRLRATRRRRRARPLRGRGVAASSSSATAGGVAVYDDYAHNPAKLAAALQAARERTEGRVLVLFQPHLYSRTRHLAQELGEALAAADAVAVADVYAAREQPVEGVTGKLVVDALSDARPGFAPGWTPEARGRRPVPRRACAGRRPGADGGRRRRRPRRAADPRRSWGPGSDAVAVHGGGGGSGRDRPARARPRSGQRGAIVTHRSRSWHPRVRISALGSRHGSGRWGLPRGARALDDGPMPMTPDADDEPDADADDRGGRPARAADDRRHRWPGAGVRTPSHRSTSCARRSPGRRPTTCPSGRSVSARTSWRPTRASRRSSSGSTASSPQIEVEGDILVAGGGAPNAVCLHRARAAGLGGFEFACAIPGTAGGGVRMNAGRVRQRLEGDPRSGRWSPAPTGRMADERGARPRRTDTPSLRPGQVVARVEFQLHLEARRPRSGRRSPTFRRAGRRRQPTNKRTFGSVFKNPEHEFGAGRLIEECGLKGHRIGGALISPAARELHRERRRCVGARRASG